MKNISKKDWKLFQEKIPIWQERYMERLLEGYIQLLNSPEPASERFRELEIRIKKDRKHPGVKLKLEKPETIWDTVSLIELGVITIDDLIDFSDDYVNAVKLILEKRKSW